MTEPRACDVLFGTPQANQDTAPAPAPPTESVAEKFFRVAEPKPAPEFMRSPEAAAAEAARIDDLEALGVKVPEGATVTSAQRIQLHDASMRAHREDQDAQVASWEAEARKLPPADVEAAQAFAREHLDDELRDVLASTGLGSHPGVIRLAARLATALSKGQR